MAENISIHTAVHSDIPGLVGLLKQLFSIEKDFAFNPQAHKRGLKIMMDGCGKHRVIKVARSGEKIVGMCTAQTRISTSSGSICAILEDLVVDQGYRELGIGSALLDQVQIWGQKKGIVQFSLLADKYNTPALLFYRKKKWRSTNMICLTKVYKSRT